MTNRRQPYRPDHAGDERRCKRNERALVPSLFVVVGLCSFGLAAHPNQAPAQDLAAPSVVPQFGHASAPTAIAIAPDGRWFATVKAEEIYLWDMKTGDILRRIASPNDIRFLALSRDGELVLARDAANTRWGWKAQTGAAVSAAEAASAEATAWNDLQHFGDGRLFLFKDHDAQNYLSQMAIDQLVPASDEYEVMETNDPDVVEVDFKTDPDPVDAMRGPALGAAFINIKARKLLAKYTPTADDADCGQPWGTFAFDGQRLVLAPSAKDASSFFTAAEVIDVAADPPKLAWKHYCRDFQVANIRMREGLILASPDPTQTTIWDPASGRALARLKEISPTAFGRQDVAVSNDRRTIVHAHMAEAEKNIYGVSVLRRGVGKLFATDERVTDVRLSLDGLTVFGETNAGWKAWSVETGRPLSGKIEPPRAPESDADATQSPDGRFRRVALERGGPPPRYKIVDSSGRSVLTVEGRLFFSGDSAHAWSLSTTQEQSVVLWDLKTGKRMWTATADQGVLVMEFSDGRVRLSKGAEKMVRLVHGFEARPFDGAAARSFIER